MLRIQPPKLMCGLASHVSMLCTVLVLPSNPQTGLRLEAGDYETMGRLMTESHVSLR